MNLEVVVRINDSDTPFYYTDLEALVTPKIDTIMLPKASVKTLSKLDKDLSKIEKEKQLVNKIKLFQLLASQFISEASEIAAMPRVDGLLLGAEDLSSDLEVVRTEED